MEVVWLSVVVQSWVFIGFGGHRQAFLTLGADDFSTCSRLLQQAASDKFFILYRLKYAKVCLTLFRNCFLFQMLKWWCNCPTRAQDGGVKFKYVNLRRKLSRDSPTCSRVRWFESSRLQVVSVSKGFYRFSKLSRYIFATLRVSSGIWRNLSPEPTIRCCGLAAWFPQMIWQMLHSCHLISYRGRIPRLSLAFWAPGTSRTAVVDGAIRVASMCPLNNTA
jgi:hypothetical protein